jgi:hypothetical protein
VLEGDTSLPCCGRRRKDTIREAYSAARSKRRGDDGLRARASLTRAARETVVVEHARGQEEHHHAQLHGVATADRQGEQPLSPCATHTCARSARRRNSSPHGDARVDAILLNARHSARHKWSVEAGSGGVILRSGRAPSRSFIFHAAPAGRPRVAPLTARSAAYADGCSRSERPKSYKIRAQTLPDMLCRNAEKRYKITAHSSQACCCCAPLVEWLYVWSGLPIHCHGLLPQSTHTGVGDVLDVRGHGHACR